jgi:hypothetical protein
MLQSKVLRDCAEELNISLDVVKQIHTPQLSRFF